MHGYPLTTVADTLKLTSSQPQADATSRKGLASKDRQSACVIQIPTRTHGLNRYLPLYAARCMGITLARAAS